MDTRQKIFEAALETFAVNGYKRTTVRDICGRAEVNVAAINYHYSGKAELYAKVFEYLFAKDQYGYAEPFREAKDAAEAEKFLTEWIRMIVSIKLDTRFRSLKRRIMLQEMLDPSEVFGSLMEKYIKPDVEILMGWLRQCRPELGKTEFPLVFFSMLAKCIFFFEHENFVRTLMGRSFVDENLDLIIKQIIKETLPPSGQ